MALNIKKLLEEWEANKLNKIEEHIDQSLADPEIQRKLYEGERIEIRFGGEPIGRRLGRKVLEKYQRLEDNFPIQLNEVKTNSGQRYEGLVFN